MSDAPKCWTREDRKARKPHKCCECRGVIQPGEVYEYFSGVWDQPDTFKTCADCAEIRALTDKGQPYDEKTPFGQLCETVSDELKERYIENQERRRQP